MGSIELLIEALNKNTESNLALLAARGEGSFSGTTVASSDTAAAPKSTGKKTAAKKEEKSGPKYSKAEVTETIVALKTTKGADAARAFLKEHGFAKLADITEDKFDTLYEGAKALLEGGDEEEASDDDI